MVKGIGLEGLRWSGGGLRGLRFSEGWPCAGSDVQEVGLLGVKWEGPTSFDDVMMSLHYITIR